MKTFLLLILTGLFVSRVSGQIAFSNIDSKLRTVKGNNSTKVICSNSTMSINFQLKQDALVMQQNDFVKIDNQVIQITPLKFSGYKNGDNNLNINDQKQLLDIYSKYELDYFKNELKIQIINPSNQWVMTKLKGWLVWYFKVGSVPIEVEVDKKTEIQLFASTVIADKILTINAPIQTGGNFTKAGLIINEMMETLNIAK